ncbi:uncharacterized protein LOC126743891 [Anthonomus grandis grandis]|uniref:uncharacterized protein LOC126743891 n=1 Tax=Anthonomus grandis grandis TaxID=2921223 RepID=UPI0021665430|nr:uncharacterized protein LOC126743891 [Anthonomus grandis grandis]
MGNILFPCGSANNKKKPDGIINISQSCIERLTKEEKESGIKYPGEELNIPVDLTEKEWILKLKCLDDAHSAEYGLTSQAFYKLADEVESKIEPIRPNICNPQDVINCLNKHGCCSIKCKSQMDKYIDCIDTFRINIIKDKIAAEQKELRREEQEIVEQFLKTDEDNTNTIPC